ncbi:hypothetical protein [Zhihengliuella sp.]|uniref:hypothetical protein n=1 Tax=Zhihengliuella sp. TaxID=1954483 RepID=UPI002810C178|nr:hypothetical protein [Zhihengliuella sp.]
MTHLPLPSRTRSGSGARRSGLAPAPAPAPDRGGGDDGTAELPNVYRAGAPFGVGELSAMAREGLLRDILTNVWVEARAGDSPTVRARAAACAAGPVAYTAVGGFSAAWVYGCAPVPRRLELYVSSFQRLPRSAAERMPIRCLEQSLEPAEIQRVAAVRVATPLRTAFDLLWREEPDDVVVRTASRLISLRALAVDAGALHEAVAGSRRRPGKVRALERLDEAVRRAPRVLERPAADATEQPAGQPR